jgi:CRP/FNR family transcriptional regulator, cyclic AMP receptor protein
MALPHIPPPLHDPELQTLAVRGSHKRYRTNALLIEEGDVGDTLFIILEGAAKVFAADQDGREIVFSEQRRGDYFGEMSLDGGPRSASVVATEPTVCAVVSRAVLEAYIGENPAFAFRLLSKVISRARLATDQAKSLALLSVYSRISVLLTKLAQPVDGALVVPEAMTHQGIAARVGASREMVTRILKDLVGGGYVSIEARRITILKTLPQGW